jgi:hypothetical protein
MLLLLALACAPKAPDETPADPSRPDATDTNVDTGDADSGDADSGDTDDTGLPDDTDTVDTGTGDTGTGDTGGTDTGGDTEPATDPVPDFTLVDINPASARLDESVSPRDYLEVVSGWYFIHTT